MTARIASEAEIGMMLDWAAEEGWNPGLDDARPFHSADPAGFFVSVRDGRPVASISVVTHSDRFAFLGLYICRPEWRGKGLGFALWKAALAHAGNRAVGLDGVAAQQANYARSGFVLAGATTRLEGRLDAGPAAFVRPATVADATAIADLDTQANGVERPRFVGAWTADAGTRRTVVSTDRRGITGFATARLCREGCKIGPIVAPDADAGLLLAGAAVQLAGADGNRAIVDVPASATGMRAALESRGFQPTFTTARMYRGEQPLTGPNLHAIATMEVG